MQLRIRSTIVFVFCCLISTFATAAQPAVSTPPIAMADFTVNSANPSFAYLGKGFSEIIAFELMKSPGVKLVDREKRNQILREMEFSMTGLTDPKSEIKMGRLLAVRFLISGSITDMAGALLVSLSMVDVESGAVVWKDQTTQPGGKYTYIGAYFGKSILKYFQMNADKSTEDTLLASKEKDEASVVALSEGIDALDTGKKEKAKKKLAEAKKIDPENKVAAAYLDKLASGSAKFKVVPERYVPYYNPAFLGGLEKDRLSINYYNAWITHGEWNSHYGETVVLEPKGRYGTGESQSAINVNYATPISENAGISVDFIVPTGTQDMVVSFSSSNLYGVVANNIMGHYHLLCSFGVDLSPNLSLGAGVSFGFNTRRYSLISWEGTPLATPDDFRSESSFSFGGVIASVLKNNSGTVAWDMETAFGTEKLHWYDPVNDVFNLYSQPVYIEQTLTFGLNNKRTYMALKQMNDIYYDRNMYYGRVMPCIEHWFSDHFSFRLGAEGTLSSLNRKLLYGYGGTSGLTLRSGPWDFDGNFTFRMRPARTLNDTIIPEAVMFFTITKNGLFK